jgi:hypothetical protein
MRRVRKVKSITGGEKPRNMLRAKLWISDNGDYDTDEEFWALLVARAGTSGLMETASNLELSMKDVGPILTPIDGDEMLFQRRGYYEEGFWPPIKCHFSVGVWIKTSRRLLSSEPISKFYFLRRLVSLTI